MFSSDNTLHATKTQWIQSAYDTISGLYLWRYEDGKE